MHQQKTLLRRTVTNEAGDSQYLGAGLAFQLPTEWVCSHLELAGHFDCLPTMLVPLRLHFCRDTQAQNIHGIRS